MTGFLLLTGLALLFLTLLIAETLLINRKIERIYLRISVSGTRGKSSIVRLLASVFRVHGMRVLAKTTGSEATYILPDGSAEKIKRKGMTTILEQKQLISKAVKQDIECLVSEIMSIHPDNHQVETFRLLKPHLTVFSNFRADHTDVAGESLKEIAELFAHDIFPGSKVIIPEEEINPFIIKEINKKGAHLIPAVTETVGNLGLPEALNERHIASNLAAVICAARHFGIPDNTIMRGILEADLDIGQLKIFRFHTGSRKIWFVNAFAANDPVSTRQIMQQVRQNLTTEISSEPLWAGLLNLRSDRGERSRQWLDFLRSEGRDLFGRIFVSGIHSGIFTRKLDICEKLISRDPGQVTRQIIGSTESDLLVFGIANIHGLGLELLKYWQTAIR